MTKAILIWGAGGHGRVLADLVDAAGYDLAGFIDRDVSKREEMSESGRGVIIPELELEECLGKQIGLPHGVESVALGIGDNHARLHGARRLGTFLAPALVHPRATLSPSARVGDGTVILAGVVINTSARIGNAVIVNTGAVIEHDCIVADGVHVSPSATLAGGVSVGECAWIGAGAVVIPGVHIGPGAMIGAGAVVLREVRAGETVVGNPARPLRRPLQHSRSAHGNG